MVHDGCGSVVLRLVADLKHRPAPSMYAGCGSEIPMGLDHLMHLRARQYGEDPAWRKLWWKPTNLDRRRRGTAASELSASSAGPEAA